MNDPKVVNKADEDVLAEIAGVEAPEPETDDDLGFEVFASRCPTAT